MAKREKKSGRKKKAALLLKKCNRCHKTQELTEFYHDRSRSDGISSKCKKCENECRKARHEKLRNRIPNELPTITSKRCSKCNEVKTVADFHVSIRNSDGYASHCKLCNKKQKQSYYRKLAARHQDEIPRIKTKRCPKCDKVKPVSQFYKAVAKVDGYRTICKVCDKNSAVQYRNKIADREFEDIQPTGKKRCCMCKRNLPVGEFNYARSNYDGLASHCRECGREYKLQHYEQYYGEYYERSRQYRREKPERHRAYSIVEEAIKNGELIRPDVCSKCGKNDDIVAHHDNYSRPLDVVWLCISCDRQLHADLRRKSSVRPKKKSNLVER